MSIQLTGLRQRFGKKQALEDVDLYLARGDIYGFIGHNGAGKTTTLRIALGLLHPRAGEVRIDGHDLRRNPRARVLVGGLIERPGFFDHFSGRRNLRMLAQLHGDRALVARLPAVLEQVGLTDAAHRPVGQYSQGMRQRLGLAQALLHGPRYLLLDEPTNGLDPQGIHELRTILQQLAEQQGVTILLSSHLLQEVADLCNRIGVLHEGRLLVEAETPELLAQRTGRYQLDTDDNDAARAALPDGCQASPQPDGTLEVLVDAADAGDIVPALASQGRKIHSWAPIRPSLEQIYLDFTTGKRVPERTEPREPSPAPAALPKFRRPIPRMVRYELGRLLRLRTALLLLAPAALAPLVIYHRRLARQRDAGELADQALATATDVTAFEALGRALQTGLPLLTVIVAALASQSIASELSGGTLRNLLMRPFRRAEILLGKFVALSLVTLLGYGLLLGTAAATAGAWFDYGDLVELLATGATFPLLPAAEVWPELWPALAVPILPLLAWSAVGLLAGTVARNAATALAFMVASWVAMELLRGFGRNFAIDGYLLGPYLPSPLASDSPMDFFVSFASGASNATNEHAALAALVPGAWLVGCVLLALLTLRRRYVA